MDSERVILVASIAAVAAVVGIFILWGPTNGTRPKKKGAVIGLQNLGLTCYLNSLLQAMASCHFFVDWLDLHENQGEVTAAMRKLINILSGRMQPCSEEEYFVSPIDVVTALHHSGWKITNSQQDVHELLCNLITILEEEAFRSCVDLTISVDVVARNLSCEKRSLSTKTFEAEFDLSNRGSSISSVNDIDDSAKNSEECQTNIRTSHGDLSSQHIFKTLSNGGNIVRNRGDGLQNYQNHLSVNSNNYRVFNDKECIRKATPHKPRFAHDLNQSPRPSPFRGYLTNKIECTRCSYKSVLRYDKFDSISLHLPDQSTQNMLTLNQLLNNFVKNELIGGIICEGCNKNRAPSTELIHAPAIKLSRFGKLPACLCIHIVRTSFYEYGVYKRQDYVDFPEYIIMDPFLQRTRNQTNPVTSVNGNDDDNVNMDASSTTLNSNAENFSKHVYRLKAVIVHRGSHNDGHFMTYRRGTIPLETTQRCSDSRWYLVSDTEVKETTLCNVLASVAYVLFYEKCSETIM